MKTNKLFIWIARGVIWICLLTSMVSALLAWIIATAEKGSVDHLSLKQLLCFWSGATVIAIPLGTFIALVWSSLHLSQSGIIDLFLTSGIGRHRVLIRYALVSGALMFGASLINEIITPFTRNVLVPVAFRENRDARPIVMTHKQGWIAVRMGESLSELEKVWIQSSSSFQEYEKLFFDGNTWVQEENQNPIKEIPAPPKLLQQRAQFLEFLSLRELLQYENVQKLWQSYVGIVIWERCLRPFFFLFWFIPLVFAILKYRWSIGITLVLATTWFLGGIVIVTGHRELAWLTQSIDLRYLILALPTVIAAGLSGIILGRRL